MNVRNAFSRQTSGALNHRSHNRIRRRRNTSNAIPKGTRFPIANATPDGELREVVAQRFMSMNEAHDRIRTELLTSRAGKTSYTFE